VTELEARVVHAIERNFGVQFVRRVHFGKWGYSDSAAELDDHTLLVLEVDAAPHPACMRILALWAYLEENRGLRAVIVRVAQAGNDPGPDSQARLVSFVASKLCDEVPEQFSCFELTIDEAGGLQGEVDELRDTLEAARTAQE